MDMDTYMTTAICTEKTDVLVLEMKHYERLFVKKHQRTIDVMRRRLEVKLNTRTSVLKEYDTIPLLKLLQIKLNLLHNPPPAADDKKKMKPETSVQIAEKLFFNHQGPLLDIEGPGSVFFMIRAREKSRLKRKAHNKERSTTRDRNAVPTVNGHLHAIRLPQSLIMAAQMAGAAETDSIYAPEIETPVLRSNVVKQNKEIDIVAKQNLPNSETKRDDCADIEHSAVTDRNENESGAFETSISRTRFMEPLPDPLPSSFRRIQSASKGHSSRHSDVGEPVTINRADVTRSLPGTRLNTRMEKHKSDANLRHLEDKVADWLKRDNPRASANVSKLRRVQVEVRMAKQSTFILLNVHFLYSHIYDILALYFYQR